MRHAESEVNDRSSEIIFSGQFDCGLTENGKTQAGLANSPVELFDKVYVSNSKRARLTWYYSNFKGKEITYTDSLKERSLGIFEGLSVNEFKSNHSYKDYWEKEKFGQFRKSFTIKAPQGENYSDVCTRVKELIKDILEDTGAKNILIISHFHTIRCLLYVLGEVSDEEVFSLSFENCEIKEYLLNTD